MKHIWLFLTLLWLAGCATTAVTDDAPQEVTVFAAASLTDVFTEMAAAYEADNPQVEVLLNFGGSSQLAAQLREGVPADVFASANPAQMDAVITAGRIRANSPAVFASNRLTIIVPADNPAHVTRLEDLAQPGVALILAVEGVPVRDYTDDIVAAQPAQFQTNFYHNLVSAEDNVRQVVAKIVLGEADAGLVYTSDVTASMAASVRQIPIPAAQNITATYPIAPLADAPQPAQAQDFITFVLSDAGQAILARGGFGPPP